MIILTGLYQVTMSPPSFMVQGHSSHQNNDLTYTVKISSHSQKSLLLTHAVVAEIVLEWEIPQSMEDGDVLKRCDPTQNEWHNRMEKGDLCNVGQQGLGNGATIPSAAFSGHPPELQEWCPGGEQMVQISKGHLP